MKKYDKLVRDKIPQILEDKGMSVFVRRAEEKEYEQYLYTKMIEETLEFMNNPSEEEFVDMMEVMDAIKKQHEFFSANLEETREDKLREKGGFNEGWILYGLEEQL